VKVAKNHTLDVNLGENSTYEVAKGVPSDQYDKWNKQEGQFQNQYNYNNAATNSWPYSYGLADLNYYGNYFYQPGWGWLWQPYYVGAGWDPFMNGAWAWYPGVGYTFVSHYPWGWMPYRYGNWAFVPGWGWCWQPGGFYGWNTAPAIVNAPAGFKAPAPPVTAVANHPTVPVRPIPRSPIGVREGAAGAAMLGGRPGRMVTSVPVHGGSMQAGRAVPMGPHGTAMTPRGSIARSPAMSTPRMGGERMGGFGSMGRSSTAGTSSRSTTSSTPHH
jgi:hypothetical protein